MAAVATEFNLRRLIQACVEEDGDNSTHAIIERVVEAVPEDFWREALRQALPTAVTSFIRPLPRKGGRSAPDRRIEAARQYKSVMDGVVRPNGMPKLLRDCQQADLLALARERKRQAEDLLHAGRVFVALAAEMKKAGASTLGDLPQRLVLEIWNG